MGDDPEMCKEHPWALERDGECVECHPIEVVNLMGGILTPSSIATIAEIAGKWGKVQVVGVAMPIHPGIIAFSLGRIFQAGEEALKNA